MSQPDFLRRSSSVNAFNVTPPTDYQPPENFPETCGRLRGYVALSSPSASNISLNHAEPAVSEQTRTQLKRDLGDYRHHYGITLPEGGEHQLRAIRSGGENIAMQFFSQPNAKGTLVVAHGYGSHTGATMPSMIEEAMQQGWNVLAFDWHGHGLSSGPQAYAESFDSYNQNYRDVLTAARDLGFVDQNKPWCTVGLSMAGNILAYETVTQPDHKPHGQLLLSPALVPRYSFTDGATLRWAGPLLRRLPDWDFMRMPMDNPAKINTKADRKPAAEVDPLRRATMPLHWAVAGYERAGTWRDMRAQSYSWPQNTQVLCAGEDHYVDNQHTQTILERISVAGTMPKITTLAGVHHALSIAAEEHINGVKEVLERVLKTAESNFSAVREETA